MLEILVADDHELMRMGLRLLLEMEEGWHVCAEAANGREAVELAGRHQPRLAIVDVNMPEMDGLDAARRIREVSPGTAVLVFTGDDSGEVQRQAQAVGAHGYVLKSEMSTRVVSAVRAITSDARREDQAPAAGSVVRGAGGERRARGRGEPSRALTAREQEIAALLADGKSNWCVAQILGISVKTVETHRGNIMHKLGLESIVELVHYAVRHELVTARDPTQHDGARSEPDAVGEAVRETRALRPAALRSS